MQSIKVLRFENPGRDYRLAVRIQRQSLQRETDAELHEKLHKISEGEVDIRYIGRLFKQEAPGAAVKPWQQTRQRPLRIGVSVGHFTITAGTLGSFAVYRKTGEVVILSNNHVLANENRARAGDAVLQPGKYDGGRRTRDRQYPGTA